jgi:Glycosyltransferase WbsX
MDFDEAKSSARLIAFYLPQFHPIPENDTWWGRGFTEWTNVSQAKPLFRGHYQPRLPADMGFYDLRVPETRAAQAELAHKYGIEGFCYWHYWFQGRRLLWRPFSDVLQSGEPNLPFCLAWANESWSRRWLGEEENVLAAQTYSEDDDMHHIQWLLQAFADRRYIRVNARPLFLIYRPRHLPDPKRTTDVFRTECVKAGLPEPFLVGIDAHCQNFDCRSIGFDSTLSFEPQLGILPGAQKLGSASNDDASLSKLLRNIRLGIFSNRLKIYDDEEARRLMFQKKPEFPYYPSIFVGWDSTPRRRENAIVIMKGSPDRFCEYLSAMIRTVAIRPFEDRLVFINAWNEWAEGNYLEPDLKWGRGYLKAVRKAAWGKPVSPCEESPIGPSREGAGLQVRDKAAGRA